jgi:hypothetical protein
MNSRLNAYLFRNSASPYLSKREDDYQNEKNTTWGLASLAIKPKFKVFSRMRQNIKGFLGH